MSDEDFSSTNTNSDEEDDSTLLASGISLKEAGNAELKNGEYLKARDLYIDALAKIKMMTEKETANDLQQAVHLNLSLAHLKLESYLEGSLNASEVLKKDPVNAKALFRRGMCQSNMGNLEEARMNLVEFLKLEPRNLEARQEIESIKSRTHKNAAQQKAQFSSMFNRASKSLYEDREADLQRRQKAEKELHDTWKDEMDKIKDESEKITFDAWRDRCNGLSQANPTVASQEPSKPKTTPINDHSLDLDAEDLKIMEETKKKGYCYFRHELTEEEKRIRDTMHVPQKIEMSDCNSTEVGTPTAISGQRGISEWNIGGTTFEEKDTWAWCERTLKRLLGDLDFGGGLRVSSVQDLKGDAQVMMVRGTKRWIFEFTVTLTYESANSQKGKLRIEEVSSINPADLCVRHLEGEKLPKATILPAFEKRLNEFTKLYRETY